MGQDFLRRFPFSCCAQSFFFLVPVSILTIPLPKLTHEIVELSAAKVSALCSLCLLFGLAFGIIAARFRMSVVIWAKVAQYIAESKEFLQI